MKKLPVIVGGAWTTTKPYRVRVECPWCGYTFEDVVEYRSLAFGYDALLCPACRKLVRIERRGNTLYEWGVKKLVLKPKPHLEPLHNEIGEVIG